MNFFKQWQRVVYVTLRLSLFTLMGISASAKAVVIDVMFLYDTYTEQYFGGSPSTAAYSWADQANGFYKTSQVDIQVRVVGVQKFDLAGTDMGQVLNTYRTNTWVNQQRTALGADLVSYIHQSGNCGVGYFAVSRDWAYNVIGPNCGNGAITFAHEAGHNMGLAHSRAQGDTGGVRYAYGIGYVVNGSFGDIMSYAWDFGAKQLSLFSNPNLTCNSVPCGVPEGNANQADAAKALNNVRTEVAGFYPTVVPEPATLSYTYCSAENQNCTFTGKRVVRFGVNGFYSHQLINDSVVCSNTVFGDPIKGTVKTCSNSSEVNSSSISYTQCASEWGTCTFSGKRIVRYGGNGQFNYQLATSSIACTNAIFGDPIKGTVKTCSISNPL